MGLNWVRLFLQERSSCKYFAGISPDGLELELKLSLLLGFELGFELGSLEGSRLGPPDRLELGFKLGADRDCQIVYNSNVSANPENTLKMPTTKDGKEYSIETMKTDQKNVVLAAVMTIV